MSKLTIANNVIASYIDVDDIRGFFSTIVEVPAGTKAMVFENGKNLGELGPGQYTLETFSSKFFSWSKKSLSLYVFRSTDFTINYSLANIPTQEGLLLNGNVLIGFSLQTPAMFLNNLLGSRKTYTAQDFEVDTKAIVMSSLQDSLALFSLKDFDKPDTRKYLETAMQSAITQALSRYGFGFRGMLVQSLYHPKYDELKKRQSDLWIAKEGRGVTDQEREEKLAEHLANITYQEKVNDLEILAKQVGMDKAEGEFAVLKRRLELDKEIRDRMQSEEFDKLASNAEREAFLFKLGNAELTREHEREELKATLNAEYESNEARRTAMRRKLDMQLQQELADFQRAYEQRVKLEVLNNEIELAKRKESEANRQWLAQLEHERADRKAQLEKLKDEESIQAQKDTIALNAALAQSRLNAVKRDEEAAAKAQELDFEERQKRLQLKLQNDAAMSQLEKLRVLNEINNAKEEHDMLMSERKARLDSELKIAEQTAAMKNQQETIRAYAAFGEKGILAILGPEQARAFAAANQAGHEDAIRAAKAEAQAESQKQLNEQMQQMYTQMMAMQERMMQAHLQAQGQQAQVIIPPMMGGMPGTPYFQGVPGAAKTLRCPNCKAEVSETSKFCPNCGKQL